MESTLTPPVGVISAAMESVKPQTSLVPIPLDSLFLVPLPLIDAVDQPRQIFVDDDEKALANQIAEERTLGGGIEGTGVLQAVLVRPIGERFLLVAGERRFRAAKMLGLPEIPAVIKEMSRSDAWRSAIVENVQRKDLSPIEEGRAFLTWMENDAISEQEIAVAIGRSESFVRQRVDSLRLADDLRRMISVKPQTTRAARELKAVPEIERRPIVQALMSGMSYNSQEQAIRDVRDRAKARSHQHKLERENEEPKLRTNGATTGKLPRVPYKDLVLRVDREMEEAIDVCATVSPQGENKRVLQAAIDKWRARLDHLETLI